MNVVMAGAAEGRQFRRNGDAAGRVKDHMVDLQPQVIGAPRSGTAVSVTPQYLLALGRSDHPGLGVKAQPIVAPMGSRSSHQADFRRLGAFYFVCRHRRPGGLVDPRGFEEKVLS